MISFVKKSLQIELDDFSKITSEKDNKITKQNFSQARHKISPKVFVYLLDKVNEQFYKDTTYITYRGYRLLAVDGTVLEIHNNEELRGTFGYIENQNGKVDHVRASALYDVENDMIITSKLVHYREGK